MILELALEYKASDIHFKANMPPVFRIDGLIRSVPDLPIFDAETLRTMLTSILTPRQQQLFEENYDPQLFYGRECYSLLPANEWQKRDADYGE